MKHLIPRPTSKLGRTLLGGALVLGGVLGFLPILGFWMIPLGLFMLSQDFAIVRRFNRRATLWAGRKWQKYKQNQ